MVRLEVSSRREVFRCDDRPDAVCWLESGLVVALTGPTVGYFKEETGKCDIAIARSGEAATCVAAASGRSHTRLPQYFAVGTAEGFVVLSYDADPFPIETTRTSFANDAVSGLCLGRDAVGRDFVIAADVTGKLVKLTPWAARPEWSKRMSWEWGDVKSGMREDYVRTFICTLPATARTPPLVCAIGNRSNPTFHGSDCMLLTTEGTIAALSRLPFTVRALCTDSTSQHASFIAASPHGVFQVPVDDGESGDDDTFNPVLLFELPCEPLGLVALPTVPRCLVVNFGCGVSVFVPVEAGGWKEAWAVETESFVSDVCAYSPDGLHGFLASTCDGALTAYSVAVASNES